MQQQQEVTEQQQHQQQQAETVATASVAEHIKEALATRSAATTKPEESHRPQGSGGCSHRQLWPVGIWEARRAAKA